MSLYLESISPCMPVKMSSLSVVEEKLPPGFRFHPRDEELVGEYLMNKVERHEQPPFLIEVDLNKCEPWDIPQTACVGGKEWYFYSQRDRKYASGLRTNRATLTGYWKATGKDRPVLRKCTLIGMRKTLVFYQGRAPKGKKTDWVMHEFRLEGPLTPNSISSAKEDWVLCRVFFKSREVPQKQNMGSCFDDTSSVSLPALTDPYITFDQTHQATMNNYNHSYEQVPCFSIFNTKQQHPYPTFSHMITHMEPNSLSTSIPPTFGGVLDPTSAYLNQSSCDKNVIKAVLDHLTKMDSNLNNIKGSPSFGEASSESFLSDVGLPNVWDNY